MTPPPPRRAIVLADGDVAERAVLDSAWPGWADGVELVVAADGGARHAAGLGLTIDHWVGDGDSLAAVEIERLREAGIRVDLVRHDKDESDTELAIDAAVAAGAGEIAVIGAFGGPRLDHALANVTLLARVGLRGRPTSLLDGAARVRLVRAPDEAGAPVALALDGRAGDLISLLPLGGDVEGVRTDGLRYPLRDETLVLGTARGLSNERLRAGASLMIRRGLLLVIETPVTLSR